MPVIKCRQRGQVVESVVLMVNVIFTFYRRHRYFFTVAIQTLVAYSAVSLERQFLALSFAW